MKIIKSLLCIALSLMLIFSSALYFVAYASTANYRYLERGVLTDGTNTAYYFIDKDRKELYLTGDGITNARTPDYPDAASGPFAGRTDVTKIIIEEDVARVGDYVFANMTAVDTLEVQSNLLSSESDMSGKAMIGCTKLRHIQGESAFLSTDVLLEVVKGAINAFSGNWVQLALNGFNVVRDGLSGNTLPDEQVDVIVNDYIATGEEVFLGEYATIQESYEQRISCPCYHENAYHHSYNATVSKSATCTQWGTHYYHCPNCGDAYSLEDIEPFGHSYESIIFVQPKCVEEGVMKNHCTRCGNNTYSAINPTGHLHGHWTVADMAAPGRRGTLRQVCDECDTQIKTKYFTVPNSTKFTYTTGLNVNANTAGNIKNNLAAEGYLIYIARNNSELADSDRIGTGTVINTIRPEAGFTTEISTAVLYGDVNGDGVVNRADKELITDDGLLGVNSIADGSVYEKAADMNGDGAIDAFDLFYCDGVATGERDFDQSREITN